MDARIKRRLRLWAALVGTGAGAGLLYLPVISPVVSPGQALRFAAQGALISALVFGFEVFAAQRLAGERLRPAPFWAAFLVKALVTTALIMLAYWIGGLLLFQVRFDGPAHLLHLARDTGYALAIALALQFVLMVRGIVGGRVLANLVLGRYHRPLREERVFLFLDVVGSTALAERLGPVGAYSLISRFFFDVAQETARHGGETHEYVGDAVVVTWPLERVVGTSRCLDCCFAIRDRVSRRAPFYRQDFGVVPAFRAGLHGGTIVAGECGDDKREIVYFGDVVNTAARIQEACKDYGRPLLVSGDLLRQMTLPPACRTTALGEVRLRGREKAFELFAVERAEG